MPNENKIESTSKSDQQKQKFDFSKVNLATGEGMKEIFDSWDEMDEYFDAYAEACEKAGVPL